MAENSNNSNDNGGSDDAILAMLEGNITISVRDQPRAEARRQ